MSDSMMTGMDVAALFQASGEPVARRRSKDAPLALDGLEHVAGLHIGIAYSMLSASLQQALDTIRLTPKWTTILWLAGANPGLSQIVLSRFLKVRRASVNQFVKALVEDGLIELRPDASDGRKLGLHLTAAGRERLSAARAIVTAHEAWLTERLSPGEVGTLLHLLAKLTDRSDADGEMPGGNS